MHADCESKIMTDQISAIKNLIQSKIPACNDLKQLEDLRQELLGKKGLITSLLSEMKTLSLDDKKVFGPQIQAVRQEAETALELQRAHIINTQAAAEIEKQKNFDVTAYAVNHRQGHLHPYTQVVREIQTIFLSMGFQVWDGPEFETDFYNFTALNIPQDHPARDMYDTFWTDKPGMLLRTHTSPVQIRAMQRSTPPIAGIAPGRTYRHEAVDASHDFMFMQCEGLVVDKNITVSHLFATAQTFLKTLFGKDELDIRIRPGFFPFVEPGFEIDMRCVFCTTGCSVCKHSTWIEVFPGGMVHPHVLRAGGIDPEVYSGFAFGFGLTRLAMLKYGIDDIRHFFSGKVKFLEQF